MEKYTTIKMHQLVMHKETLLSLKPPTQGMVELNFDGALVALRGL